MNVVSISNHYSRVNRVGIAAPISRNMRSADLGWINEGNANFVINVGEGLDLIPDIFYSVQLGDGNNIVNFGKELRESKCWARVGNGNNILNFYSDGDASAHVGDGDNCVNFHGTHKNTLTVGLSNTIVFVDKNCSVEVKSCLNNNVLNLKPGRYEVSSRLEVLPRIDEAWVVV